MLGGGNSGAFSPFSVKAIYNEEKYSNLSQVFIVLYAAGVGLGHDSL